jgi:hypothetical protein
VPGEAFEEREAVPAGAAAGEVEHVA